MTTLMISKINEVKKKQKLFTKILNNRLTKFMDPKPEPSDLIPVVPGFDRPPWNRYQEFPIKFCFHTSKGNKK